MNQPRFFFRDVTLHLRFVEPLREQQLTNRGHFYSLPKQKYEMNLQVKANKRSGRPSWRADWVDKSTALICVTEIGLLGLNGHQPSSRFSESACRTPRVILWPLHASVCTHLHMSHSQKKWGSLVHGRIFMCFLGMGRDFPEIQVLILFVLFF